MNFKQATTHVLILNVIQRGALQTHCLQHWGYYYILLLLFPSLCYSTCSNFLLSSNSSCFKTCNQEDHEAQGGMKMMMFLTAVACLEVILSRLALAYLGCFSSSGINCGVSSSRLHKSRNCGVSVSPLTYLVTQRLFSCLLLKPCLVVCGQEDSFNHQP